MTDLGKRPFFFPILVAIEPIREVLESAESDVIHCWALDSSGGAADVEARTPLGSSEMLKFSPNAHRKS
jgi:hypothetical protein